VYEDGTYIFILIYMRTHGDGKSKKKKKKLLFTLQPDFTDQTPQMSVAFLKQ
jgi:hypothetical protein